LRDAELSVMLTEACIFVHLSISLGLSAVFLDHKIERLLLKLLIAYNKDAHRNVTSFQNLANTITTTEQGSEVEVE